MVSVSAVAVAPRTLNGTVVSCLPGRRVTAVPPRSQSPCTQQVVRRPLRVAVRGNVPADQSVALC